MYDACWLVDSLGRIQWVSTIPSDLKSAGMNYDNFKGSYVWDWSENKKSEIQAAIVSAQHFGETHTLRGICTLRNEDIYWNIDVSYVHLDLVCFQGTAYPAAVHHLSEREMEVLGLLGKHLTLTRIARQLKISVSTVETHRRSIRKKLSTFYQALPSIAQRAGLAEDPFSPQ